ncbi:MAG: HDOD domain-containing protein [bacterium]|nr:HDOD domain-containing protein [bacterium]
MNINIEGIIQKIEYFPDRPGSAYKILGGPDAAEVTTEELLKLLEYDIAVTTNVMKFCNSSVFPAGRKINSLKEAVQYLDRKELRKVITMSASTDIFAKGSGYTGYESGLGEMRRHSIAAAVISKHLLQYVPEDVRKTSDLFTTCLLHDIGKIVLSQYVGEHNEKISRLMEEKQYDFAEAEKEVIGMTHAEVGARILEKWTFPPDMITAVRYHHDPEAVPDSALTHFVSLTDTVAMLMGYTTAIDALDYKGFPQLFKKYKMKEKDIELISMNAIDEIKNAIPFERRKKPRG